MFAPPRYRAIDLLKKKFPNAAAFEFWNEGMTLKTNEANIVALLEKIDAGKIQLPDFQRGWVWDDNRIRKLIASITSGFPIGAVMFLSYGSSEVKFQHRMIEGAPPRPEVQPEELILDGQQRLTAIYDAMFSKNPVKTKNENGSKNIERFYYIDIEKALNPVVERIDAIVSVPREKMITLNFGKKIDFDVRTPENEYQQKMFPLNISFDGNSEWQADYLAYHQNDPVIRAEYFKFQKEIISRLAQYQLPIISMEKETPLEAICQVFENVNTGGVSLTVFELLTATFAIDIFRLREDWENRRSQYFSGEILSAVTATDFLAAGTLLSSYRSKGGGSVNYKRRDILKLKLADYKSCADILTDGFVEAEKFLHEERIFSSRDLPYTTQLILLAVLLTILAEKNLANASSVREKLRQWYWCGVFGENSNSADRLATDVAEMLEWISGTGEPPKIVRECNLNPMRLLTFQTRSSAAYKGFMALILKNSARDFISGREMGFLKLYRDENIDIHHIFPKSYCERKNLPQPKWNSIVNKTPLFYKTNRAIGGRAPKDYLKKIQQDEQVNHPNLENYLASHWISIRDCEEDDFAEFIANRAGCLLDAVEKVTGKKILGRDSDEVIKFFGRAI